MFEKPEVLRMAAAASANAAARLGAIAENVANADTPGYRARDFASFRETYRQGDALALAATRPGHLSAPPAFARVEVSARAEGHMSPNGNNVSLEGEMMGAALVRKDHDLALTVYKSALTLLRSSLGRR
jgi:flagellar basal-body rod protein FlgB